MLRQSEGKAIPFIVKDQSNLYSLTPQAQSFLSQLEAPLTIVTVAGLYRTGKSYLLNRILLNRANGFGVGPTVNPCTKGLWLWAQPIRVSQGRTLLVIDTQGLGALDEESNHDMKIFSLAVLLSTNFIYNSVGSIDQTALQTLSLALHLIGTIDRSNVWNKPNLLWVVRDFSLQLINQRNQSITSSQYLDMALATDHIKEPQKLQLRKIITQSFSQRDCFTLIKPLIDEQRLQALDRIPVEQLRPQFVSQSITLRKFIMSSLKQMKMNGSEVLNGKQYVMMIGKYLNAINEGQMPDLADTWTFIKQEKARAAAEEAKQNYNEILMTRFGPRLPMPAQKLTQLLASLRKQISEQFVKNCYQQTANSQLIQFIQSRQAQVMRLNAKQNKNVLNDILRREFEPFQKKLLSEYYCQLSAYEQDLKQTFTKILPEKYSDRIDIAPLQLELFSERRIIEAAKIFERKSRQQTSRIRQLKNQSQTTLQTELRNLSRLMQDQRKKYQEELLQAERKMILLASKKQRLEQTLQKVKNQELVEAQKTKKKAQINQNLAQNLQSEVQKMSSLVAQQEKTIFSLKKQLQKEKALSSQKQDYMSGKLQQQQSKIKQIISENEKTLKIWELQKRELLTIQENKQQVLMRENKQIADHLQELTHQLESQRFMNKKLQEELINFKSKHQEELLSYKQKLNCSNKKQAKKEDEEAVLKLKEYMCMNEKVVKQNKQLEYKCKQLSEQIKITKNNCDKEVAICNQKMQFQQIQINELKIKNNELNQSYQRYLQHAHHDANIVEQQYLKKINQINTDHQNRIKYIEEDFERKFKEVKRENAMLIERNSQMQMQVGSLKKKWMEKQHQLLQNNRKIEKAYQEALHRLSDAQNDQVSCIKQRELFYQNKIRQLESEIESINDRVAKEIEDCNRKAEQNLTTLKNYAEQERIQWQKRIDDQREKNNKKIKEIQGDWLTRLQDQKEPLQNTISELNQRIMALEEDNNKRIQALRCDYEIRMQKVTNSSIEERMEIKKKLALVQQEAGMVKRSLQNQLDQSYKNYQQSLQSVRREITYDYQQQLKAVRESLQASQRKNQTLHKSLRKAEQSNFILKSEIDKQKAVGKQKVENLIKERRQIQQRYKYDREMHNRAFQEASNTHLMEQKRLNEDIDKLADRLRRAQEEKMKITNEFEQQKSSLMAKITYMQGKVKRFKQNEEDLLNKFETTVKSLSKNNKSDIEKDFLQRLEKMKEDYNRKMIEKQEAVYQQRKEKDDKLLRLQTQNKSLRDRLLLFEMRESGKKGREEDHADQMDRLKEMYQKRLQEMRQELQRYVKQLKHIKDERDYYMQNTVKMQKSKISQRHSFINQNHNMDTSYNKSLRENKSLLNCRPTPVSTQPKKQYRVMNMEDVTGIMKWQPQ